MAKPIYFSLLLLVLCLIYETYGNYHNIVRHHMRLPSRRFSNNIVPYDSSSSSLSTTGSEANGAVADAAATSLSPSSSLRKSFNKNNSLGYGRNRALGQNSKSLSGKYYEQEPNFMDSDDLNNEKTQNSMRSSRFLNNKPLTDVYYRNNEIDRQNRMPSGVLKSKPLGGLYNINNQNINTLEDQNIRKRQNSITSDSQDFPDVTKTNPLFRGIVRQKTLSPSSNEDDSQQQMRVGDNSNMMDMKSSIKKPLNRQNIIVKSLRRCCINGNCRVLQDGEECNFEDYFKNMKTEQQPNNPMFTTSSNGDNGLNDIMSKLKLFDQGSFNSLGGNMGDFQKMKNPTNMRLGSFKYSTTIPSNGLSNGMGSNVMPQKRKPVNYPHSDPIDLSEDEANEIRNQVLQKSNFYREKYNLEPFTLDDQMNNYAQDWANQMVKLQIFDHRQDNVYGENLYANSELNNLGENAVEKWYNEITKFNIDDDETELNDNVATHHMTQLLWKSSTKLGVGVSRNEDGMYNVVANYDPSGNVEGIYKENLPEIKQKDIEEATELQNSQTAESGQNLRSWSSSSKSPLQSEWNYGPYYNQDY